MSCRFCRHFEVDEGAPDNEKGVCRRRSPVPALCEGGRGRALAQVAVWPTVAADDWCGEYEGRRVS